MKIKLIAPARKFEQGVDFWDISTAVKLRGKKAGGPYLSLYILATLTPPEAEVLIIDERVEQIKYDDEVDLVGITVVTSLASRAYEIADEYRRRGIPVIMGGIHVSVLPQEALQHCDAVVIGEAEVVWGQVVADARNKNLKKIYQAQEFADLAKSPIPRWDLLNHEKYTYFTLQTGRGCPYDCEFCLVKTFNGRVYRCRNIDQVMREIAQLQILNSKKLIFFVDDNLLAVPEYAKDFFSRLIPRKVRWWCQSSVNNLDNDEMLGLMARAGCKMVFVGIESVSQASLSMMNKNRVNHVDEYKRIIDKVHAKGIAVFGSFVIGNDTDDAQIFEKTAAFIDETTLAYSMINILTPPPGSRLFERLEKEGRIVHKNWGNYNTDQVCFKPLLMSEDELRLGREHILRKIYSYDALFKRLVSLWKRGILRSRSKNILRLFTVGRFAFVCKCFFMGYDAKRMAFVLKSLGNPNVGSVASVSLALSFHDYAFSNAKVKNSNGKN